jgi:urease accessory protein
MSTVQQFSHVIGFASDPEIAEKLHALTHRSLVEYLTLDSGDVHRRRFRRSTDQGTDCLIALPREQALGDGAVLMLEGSRAIVVRLAAERWLALEPRDSAAALELGYFAGNLHWRVRFEGGRLLVALEGPEEDYLSRLKPFLDDGRARRADHD